MSSSNGPPGQSDAARAAIRAAWEQGRAAWPAVDLPEHVFAQHLARLAAQAGAGDDTLETLHGADLYLACACGHGAPAAIRALERDYLAHVPRYIGKTSSDPVLADEVLQGLREKLLVRDGGPPKILEYGGRGSLGAWLRVSAIRAAQTILRRRQTDDKLVSSASADGVAASGATAEADMLRRRLGPKVHDAFCEALRGLSAEQRNLLRLHYFDGLSFERLGALFRVNRATACRWVAEARRTILARTRQRLRDELGLRDSDLDELTRLLRSQIDVSISSILAEE